MQTEYITTDRLVLRPWQDADAPELYPLASDPAVGPRAGWAPHASVEETRAVIADVLRGPESYAVCLKGPDGSPGALVGACALKPPAASDYAEGPDERELGYWVGVPHQGRGLAAEAARALVEHAREDLGVRRVWCCHYVGNDASRRVQEKCGFVAVRVVRDVAVELLGERRDEVVSLIDFAQADPVADACALLAAQAAPERYLSITEPAKLGRMRVVLAAPDLGVMTRMERNGCYFAAPFGAEAARAMAAVVPAGAMVSLVDDTLAPVFRPAEEPDTYELWAPRGPLPRADVTAAAGPAEPESPAAAAGPALSIRLLTRADLDVVDRHYDLLPREAIADHLERGWIWGGFTAAGELVGFIGEHDEASMGMLEVFPEARRHGCGRALEQALIAHFTACGQTPYCHIAPGNVASQRLQAQLGLAYTGINQCWFRTAPRP